MYALVQAPGAQPGDSGPYRTGYESVPGISSAAGTREPYAGSATSAGGFLSSTEREE